MSDDTPMIDQLVELCRTTLGDELRSVVYFTSDDYDQLYVRENLTAEADVESFVENERLGFSRRNTDVQSELGTYDFTIHAFENGYLTRMIAGESGVFLTTDDLSMRRFEETAAAVEDLLTESNVD